MKKLFPKVIMLTETNQTASNWFKQFTISTSDTVAPLLPATQLKASMNGITLADLA